MSDRPQQPRRLDPKRLAEQGATLEGSEPLADFARLRDGLAEGSPADPLVHWQARGELRREAGGAPQTWLHLQARAEVPMTCQRCLQALTETLRLSRSFRFVPGEAEAARLDEQSDDDVLALPARLDLLELLEDELILSLPLVPRHEHCPQPLPVPPDEPEVPEDDAGRENPFAALAALKRRQRPN